MEHTTFKHSGDLGDIIYSLPTIKSLGGGVLYLDITGGEKEPACIAQCYNHKTTFNKSSYEFIRPLLVKQPYIQDVKIYNGEQIKYNLDTFRNLFNITSRNSKKNLLDLHLEAFNLPEWDHNTAWLTVDNSVSLHRKTIVCRSARYQSSYLWFHMIKKELKDKAIFLGLPKEHEIFEYMFDIKIPYHSVKDAYELAQILNGCTALISNGTFALSVGIGLGTVPIMQELYNPVPSCVFEHKKNMNYISL